MFNVNSIRALVLIVAVACLLGIPSKSGAAPTTLTVGMYCISLGHARLECHVEVNGGTPPYSYTWTPPRTGGSNTIAIIPCARAYSNQTVYLTVTDSLGATASTSDTHYCGDAE